jgi:hypothetical protein
MFDFMTETFFFLGGGVSYLSKHNYIFIYEDLTLPLKNIINLLKLYI